MENDEYGHICNFLKVVRAFDNFKTTLFYKF